MGTMTSKTSPARVAVVGGGVTGLTAATELLRAGVGVTLFERAGRPGGVVSAVREDGWLRELGPNSLLEGARRERRARLPGGAGRRVPHGIRRAR
jgi:protoporphyrinogen oxidase